MTTMSYALRDSTTMLRRDFRHSLRYPMMTFSSVLMPIIMLLLFSFVLGGAITSGNGNYVNYLVPGIMVMAVGAGCGATAVNISADMTEGIVDRFRTMAIFRPSVLVGQVLGASIRILASLVLVVGVALLVGFRPHASFGDWLVVAGVLVLLVSAFTWLSVAFGLIAKTPGGANSATMPLQFLLPFMSSAFVDTQSMPAGVRWFAENEPLTPVIDTIRGLLLGNPIGNTAWLAVGWCIVLTVVGYLWAKKLFNR
jgi:ABC-2 type transport system permease protein